jgi:hypothetical protein
VESSVNKRVKEIIESKKVSDNKFAHTIGIGQKVLSSMFIRSTEPSVKTISAILDAFPDISAEWLLRGVGAMNKTDAIISEEEKSTSYKELEQKICTRI